VVTATAAIWNLTTHPLDLRLAVDSLQLGDLLGDLLLQVLDGALIKLRAWHTHKVQALGDADGLLRLSCQLRLNQGLLNCCPIGMRGVAVGFSHGMFGNQ
jgi:hypothetical protein